MSDDLPPLREVVATYGLTAKKSLGQNFLFDLNLTGKIARAAGPLAETTVVEIGPGPGGLTRALLNEGAAHVIAIERDSRCLAALAEIAAHYPGRLEIIEGDALTIDLGALVGARRPARICANLPYNIATVLLTNWLESASWPPWFDRLVLMFQKEVALRIVATPATRADYGRLAVLANWRCMTRILFDVPAAAFTPPPKVTSSVVELVPRATPLPCDMKLLSQVTQAAFGQRRKMLRQSLRSLSVDPIGLLAKAGIDPTKRAEEIDVEGFVALARALEQERNGEHPVAIDVRFDEATIHISLADGREISAPLESFPRLRDASPEQRRHWRLIGRGEGIHWPEVDEDISINDLLGHRT